GRQQRRIDGDIAGLARVAHEHAPDLQRIADLPRVDRGLLLQDARHARPDDAEAEEADADRPALTAHCRARRAAAAPTACLPRPAPSPRAPSRPPPASLPPPASGRLLPSAAGSPPPPSA